MHKISGSIKNKILLMTTMVLVVSNIAIGLLGYNTSKQQLNEKGEIILQNAVETAIQMIDLAEQGVKKGTFTLDQAQEMVKEYLLGEMKEDGIRPINSPLDLGESGYFVVYSQEGVEIAHPSLEGKNVWDVTDKAGTGVFLVQDSIQKAKDGGGFTYYDWFLPHSENIGKKIVFNKLDPNWGWVVTAGSYEMDFNKGAVNVLKYTSAGVLIFLVLVIIVMYNFSNRMGKALEGVTKRADNIANLDVTEDIPHVLTNRKDEIGSLANSFQRILDNLRIFSRQISESAIHLASSSNELTISSEQSAIAADEVARAIEEIAKGATHQALDTEKGAKHIADLGGLVEKNEDYLKQLNDSTIEVGKLKDEGFETLGELMQATESSNDATMEIQNVIDSTNESAEKIENASNMIRSIAEQTNLLALNAAIEAARAGEAGRGFAVVADEIRKLAEQSNGFTEEITEIITDLNNKISQAVTTMKEVSEISKLQNQSVEQTNDKFIGISKAIESMNKVIDLINKSGQEMINKKDVIVEIIYNLSSISQENAAGTEEASASVEEQTATMMEIANSSEILAGLANEMQEAISKFKA
ncbi:cache domain-containing protein [Tissierella sp.]|uniref:methyl-accepting chemotaxis protein n=1 Tax=Tissierella sp. TaxID=41274 RepID=UPI002863837D|nr:cache domain-containing protein [Tissierella sp.]MDR7855467.1 cache domain-containing protein [Tissierella sp.]